MNIIYELNKIFIYHPHFTIRNIAELYLAKLGNNMEVDMGEIEEFIKVNVLNA